MFTGIIEEIGVIENIRRGDKYCNLTVKAKKVLDDVHIGDSIAVNGICLTVTYFNTDIFTADIMNETWNRTALKKLDRGSKVNLERAMSADGRFGGHIVSGHIDGTGTIKTVRRDNNAVWFQIEPSKEILEYVVEKGSIAVDGISLTVAKVTARDFYISVIPHTLEQTILRNKKVNDIVNLENDIIGKYIKKFVENDTGISKEFLLNNGF